MTTQTAIPEPLPEDIARFVDEMKRAKTDRPLCRSCPLYPKPPVILDTNMDGFGPVDVAFVGLNPGTVEVKLDRPFVGPAGKLLRRKLDLLPPGTRWLITNTLLCHTRNEAEIEDPAKAMAHCRPFMGLVLDRFPPALCVPVGGKPIRWAGIKDPMTTASGKMYPGNVMPLVHPSAVLRFPGKYGRMFEDGFEAIARQVAAGRR
jgi:DNA polymerase